MFLCVDTVIQQTGKPGTSSFITQDAVELLGKLIFSMQIIGIEKAVTVHLMTQ